MQPKTVQACAYFDTAQSLHKLKHYLPNQNPLKDFIHHNTLHAFQHEIFHQAAEKANRIFGYKTYLSLSEYRQMYHEGKINQAIFEEKIKRAKGEEAFAQWSQKLLHENFDESTSERIGRLRNKWQDFLKFNLDKNVHPTLFRLACGYLDQGISLWHFPNIEKSFLSAVRKLQKSSFVPLVMSKRAQKYLNDSYYKIEDLLKIIVGDDAWYEQYLFDQQFAHPGWSGMFSVLEDDRNLLLDQRKVRYEEFIFLELLLEIDALDTKFGESNWHPLAHSLPTDDVPRLFDPILHDVLFDVYSIWQEIFEWSYYDQVLLGLTRSTPLPETVTKSLQAILCIDDRECSFRRHIEKVIPGSETFGTAGFFNVEFYFQPEHGKFYTKSCPAPVKPKYLIKEYEAKKRHKSDWHLNKRGQGVAGGWLLSQTLGFWSALKLAGNIFKPSFSALHVSSFHHMDQNGKLAFKSKQETEYVHHLQLGFTIEEIANRMEGLLKSIGLINDFAPLVYLIGHGASSVNNTHYAGYDCGACSGRPGSVNARVAASMLNLVEVRLELRSRGINIPSDTHFVAALHDTTRDEIEFYDEQLIPFDLKAMHQAYQVKFNEALTLNAKERSRKFFLEDTKSSKEKIHARVKLRALSLFEPRPEWNHATNALCIVGRRSSNKHLFLDRRAFLNSYDYSKDPDGTNLLNILKAVAPVCGGINLEYYFSKVDKERLGAGSKLPHNVIGLLGVANGIDGDLRTGLPAQMVDIHQPLRLMVIVEQYPEVIEKVLQEHEPTQEWFRNQWIHLSAIHPESKEVFVFSDGKFSKYECVNTQLPVAQSIDSTVAAPDGEISVYILKD
ncbi:MAG: YbcC family protein [Flavobacteriales bacterium]